MSEFHSAEAVLVWHFTSCGSCIFDAVVGILKTALFFCGAVAFVTFSVIALGLCFLCCNSKVSYRDLDTTSKSKCCVFVFLNKRSEIL